LGVVTDEQRHLCNQSTMTKASQIDPSLHVPFLPQFSVDVQLSEAAKKKLIDSKEAIIIAAYLTGHPKQGTEPRLSRHQIGRH